MSELLTFHGPRLFPGKYFFIKSIVYTNRWFFFRIKIKESPIDLIYAPVRLFDKSPCSWMKYMKHQYRLCKRDLMLSEVLLTARKLAIFDCEEQFRFDRWNCSRKKSVFKRVHRETALLYAMAASAITFSVARACSEGKKFLILKLNRCITFQTFIIKKEVRSKICITNHIKTNTYVGIYTKNIS